MAASVQLNYKAGDCGIQAAVEGDGEEPEQSGPDETGEGVKLSRAEAKLAWLSTGGDTERAVRQLLRDRQLKVGKGKINVQHNSVKNIYSCLHCFSFLSLNVERHKEKYKPVFILFS